MILTAPDGAREIRRIPLDWIRIDQPYEFALDAVADDQAEAVALLACSHADFLDVSLTGGAPFFDVPIDVQNGFDLGSFSAGERKTLTFEFRIPAATEIREDQIELYLGTGV